jgi:hypothetical protein
LLEVNGPKYITKKQTYERVSVLVTQILLSVLGNTFNAQDIALIIVNAAANCSTINTIARQSQREASQIRYYCRKLKKKGALIVEQINILLLIQTRTLLKTGIPYEFAIDTNEKEIYTPQETEYIIKSKGKNGTNKFVSHATLYAMVGMKRVTIAFIRIRKGLSRAEIVKELVGVLLRENFCIKRLYLDRGFYSVAVVQYLKSLETNAIIAMPIKGKKKGLRSRLKGRKSYWITDYEAISIATGERQSVTHSVAVIATYQMGRRGKRGLRWYTYTVIGEKISLKRIRNVYRGRFGIETSYRIKNQSLAWTTSPLPEIRTLYFGISLLIQNEWISVNWFYFRYRRRGRPSGKPLLQFVDFLELLIEGCKDILGRLDRIEALCWYPEGPFG